MAVAELVLKYVEALVWPVVTLVLAWACRHHLKRAFDRMTRLETPAGAIDFAEEARRTYDDTREQASSSPPRVPGQPSRPLPSQSGNVVRTHLRARSTQYEALDQALDLVGHSPDSAVMLAWRAVEVAYRDLLGGTRSVQEAARQLEGRGLPHSVAETMVRLARLRARVSHGDHTVFPDAAFDFVASCEVVLDHLAVVSQFGAEVSEQ
ncbi:hypothetical protein [Streptomyces asoensis]|uniref:hypothetical protein n=1 Tax=Streptomyces asoensis TaxID=249586 RepID=UPI00167B3840|nr:hypothetical protein [Streptomyces asoensis]